MFAGEGQERAAGDLDARFFLVGFGRIARCRRGVGWGVDIGPHQPVATGNRRPKAVGGIR